MSTSQTDRIAEIEARTDAWHKYRPEGENGLFFELLDVTQADIRFLLSRIRELERDTLPVERVREVLRERIKRHQEEALDFSDSAGNGIDECVTIASALHIPLEGE